MKRILKYCMTTLPALGLLFTAAADGLEGKAAVLRNGDRLSVRFPLGGCESGITANEQLTITPVVVNGTNRVALPPVVFTGRIREKVNLRRERLHGTPALPDGTYTQIVLRGSRKERSANTETYTANIPYEPWMAGGQLLLYRNLVGCGGHSMSLAPLAVAQIAVPVRPHLSFLIPVDEPPKRRSEQITAVVHFPQGRSVLLRDFADNSRQLARIDSLTLRLQDNDSLTIETVYLKGYASPEDTYAFNTRLSANRARTLRNYLENRFGLAEAEFTVATEPEDWDSLRRWVVLSDLPARDEVLAVIDTTPNPDARDARIRSIDNGKTYLFLLNEVYPQLRRVDYRIGYLLPAFTLDQSRRLLDTHPEWLSLTEMCRVAESYPIDSPERAHACAVALEYHPDDPCACNNMAMLALYEGDRTMARRCLERCGDDPRVQNNLGVLCLLEGDPVEARNCFSIAAQNGSEEAAFNLSHFRDLGTDLWISDVQ